MKMVFAIISKADEDITVTALNEAGFFATRLSTIGGFLKKTNTSVIVGTEDDKVPHVLEIIKKYAGHRTVCDCPHKCGRCNGFRS